ncbi:hypothetical protein [Streptomyces sp. MZ04]|uniref:hypothetical protein n=1 Tax=Streptomyces sp. MZ04 TaxID=2559236 RepID=UPI00107EBB53|nr:hypothetical protein [Streptomyces sp. MZ04]TGB16237.1 hypothetical protein E2651_00105 [Streptomyces sp. MZ04]
MRHIPSVPRSSAARKAVAAALVGATVAGTAVLAATPASALSWKCNSSSRTIDDAGYSGPWGDNWDFTVKNCVARSGGYIYAKATVSWDAPPWYAGTDLSNTFDNAHFRLYVKHADGGADTVLGKKTFYIQDNLATMNGSGNGSWTTSTAKKYVGGKSAYTDGALLLDWNNDGDDARHYGFEGSGSK